MADETRGGLFDRGIVPLGSRDEADDALRRARQRQDREQLREDQPGNQSQRGGLATGQRLGNLFRGRQGKTGDFFRNATPTDLTDAQQRQFTIKENGQNAFNERRREMGDEFDALSANAQNQMLMTEMAKSALAEGDTDTFSQLQQAIVQQRDADRLREANIAKAEGEAAALNDPTARDRTLAEAAFTTQERSQARDAGKAFQTQLDATNNVMDVVERVTAAGQNPNVLMRGPGGVTSFVQEAKSAIGYAVDELISYEVKDSEGNVTESFTLPNTAAGQQALAERDAAYAAGLSHITIPVDASGVPMIRGAAARAQYKAAMIQMAYAQWRQNEGSGSRQASNQDIIMALDSIGANSGDVSVMLSTIMQSARLGAQKGQRSLDSAFVIADKNGITRDFMERGFFGVDIAATNARMTKLERRFGTLTEDTLPESENPIVAPNQLTFDAATATNADILAEYGTEINAPSVAP